MVESTEAALDFLRAERVPAVVLEPHVDADAEVVMAAADHVAELLPKPPRTYSIGERLDGITLERLKALGRAVI